MNIVLVFDGLQVGGIERVGVDYARLLSERGHKVSVVNLMPELNAMYKQLTKKCKVYEFKYTRSCVPYRYTKLVESGVWGAAAYAGVGTILGAANGCRVLASGFRFKELRDTDYVIAFSGHYNDLMFVASGFIPGNRVAWLHGSEAEYKIISDGFFCLYKRIRNLVCLSELCDVICKQFNEKNQIKKRKIYNPITIAAKEVDAQKVASLKEKYGEFALMVGRLAPDKDQKTAIKAIKLLNHEQKEKRHLLLAGDGPNRQMLEEFTKKQGAESYVHFLGNCFDVQNYYSAAHVYVHSSPMEGLPTALLEALAYNLPIASTDSMPGVREILGDNEYGLISPIENPAELAKNISRLYDDAELRLTLQQKGSERIKDFSPGTVISQLEEYLSELK